ncbi:MAG: GDSL-type esterase/lipase family protein [Caulobacterales bacterium]
MRICFFGDSFVNGTGDDEALGWVGRVSAHARQSGIDLTTYNLGVRRDTSADIARRWRTEAQTRLPDGVDGRLVFSFGVNDCSAEHEKSAPRLSHAATLANAHSILNEAAQWRPTLLVGPTPVMASAGQNDRISALSEALFALCARLNIPFIATTAFADEYAAQWRAQAEAGDGAHPAAAGYAALSAFILESAAWRRWL